MKCRGAQAIVNCLLERGVDTVFGYPGGAVLDLYDALYDAADSLRHVRTAHEQGAAHAADGYARSTGRTGVVIATSGPGATNLVTGLATAFMDSTPLVAITGNVARALIGRDAFQEIDIAGVTMPVTKHNFVVRDPDRLVPTLREAFDIAESGRKGPVLVDIPKDLSRAMVDYERAPRRKASKPVSASAHELLRAARAIAESRRPFIHAGGGAVAADAGAALLALAERLRAPVALSLMGLGLVPAAHELCTGMMGMHGSRASNRASMRADLLIAVGTRFSDRVVSDPARFAPGAKLLQLDIDPAEIGKNLPVDLFLEGDVRGNLEKLVELVPARGGGTWAAEVDRWRTEDREAAQRGPSARPHAIMRTIRRRAGEDAIVTTEVGQHQMWVAQHYPFSKPRQFLTSGGLGTMGFGTGAAIGAQTGNPGRRVIHVAGDGSFRMNLNELATIAEHRLPIVVVIINNGVLGMVRQWQSRFYGARYSATTLEASPDFLKLADAFGIPAWRAADDASLDAALGDALASGGPALVECIVHEDEQVLPMVPPGGALDEQILG